ncbi:LytR/AlgR family response regulator transcription factor [Mangrovibacillus cuniculi]|uniref:Response regulator transcription factor n=1 Tax=Mangrovibacillus cuniculi TaxID=2593652 RepID=A0A7S8HFI6_9BACI|nr:LytTR family DNA-binding domain-containing protein [Mangrovibacillus cuniculi]QPC46475.1 response regulator transcription factor [Mangrovibacillus cuniculi]
MDPITIIIAEDDEASEEILSLFIDQLEEFIVLDTARSGDELVEKVMNRKPDLVFADINLPQMNGMEAVKKSLTFHSDLKVVFITGYDQYAVEAFEIAAVDYIVKPIEKFRVYQALEKVKKEIVYMRTTIESTSSMNKMDSRLSVKFKGIVSYISFEDIIFIEKNGKKSIIYTEFEQYETYENLSVIVKQLDERFFPCHRSYIINVDYISQIKPKNETYLVYFNKIDHYAHASKLKIKDLFSKINSSMET